MPFHAANSAATAPPVSKTRFRRSATSLKTQAMAVAKCRPFARLLPLRMELRFGRTSAARGTDGELWSSMASAVSYPVLCSVTLRGQTGALRLGVVLLRLRRPFGSRFLPEQVCKRAAKSAAQTSSGPRQESTPWHLGAGPTRSLRHV